MERRKADIPLTTVYRLSYYYRALQECGTTSFISSRDLARLTGFGDALVRRDLSYFGKFGIPGRGYPVLELREKISGILGIDRKWKVALIGLGNLGSALLRYKAFEKQGFEIVAIFDNDPAKIKKSRSGIEIQDINQLQAEFERGRVKMAIITVPGDAAEEVIGRVVSSGMKAILNFAPIKVKVPDSVSVVNIDFSVELERLSCMAIGEG